MYTLYSLVIKESVFIMRHHLVGGDLSDHRSDVESPSFKLQDAKSKHTALTARHWRSCVTYSRSVENKKPELRTTLSQKSAEVAAPLSCITMLQVLTTLHLKDGFDLHRAEYQLLLRL